MKAVELRCEYLADPRGIEETTPRLMWRIDDDRPGACQTAYRIRVASSTEMLADGQADLWDSGRIETDETTNIRYEGAALQTAQQAFWCVQTWDLNGEPAEDSDTATWEMGLLSRDDWREAQWIGSSLVGSRQTSVPCPYLRRPFELPGTIASARLYITALGLYEATLNGQPVSDAVFSPGWTDYRNRVQYQVYDVTGLLQSGDNVIGAILGDGWYCGHVAWSGRQNYGDRPRLLALLHAELEDGTAVDLVTDDSWRWTTGPIIESDFLMGECYDARLEMPGWDQVGFADADWHAVSVFDDPGIERSPMLGPPVRRQETLNPIADPKPLGNSNQGRRWLFDLGQNMAGRVRLRIQGEPGQLVTIRHAEMLDENGHLYQGLGNVRCAAPLFGTSVGCQGGGENRRRINHGVQVARALNSRECVPEDSVDGFAVRLVFVEQLVAGAFDAVHLGVGEQPLQNGEVLSPGDNGVVRTLEDGNVRRRERRPVFDAFLPFAEFFKPAEGHGPDAHGVAAKHAHGFGVVRDGALDARNPVDKGVGQGMAQLGRTGGPRPDQRCQEDNAFEPRGGGVVAPLVQQRENRGGTRAVRHQPERSRRVCAGGPDDGGQDIGVDLEVVHGGGIAVGEPVPGHVVDHDRESPVGEGPNGAAVQGGVVQVAVQQDHRPPRGAIWGEPLNCDVEPARRNGADAVNKSLAGQLEILHIPSLCRRECAGRGLGPRR